MLHIDPARDMLAVIDVQPTFMPGGELPVPQGDEIVPVINRLLDGRLASAFATQDWHPPKHSSFASTHPAAAPFSRITLAYGPQTLWPDHAIQGSRNAALHPGLRQDKLQLILRKGTNPAIDSYSAFMENDRRTPTGLAGWLRDRGITRLFFCGLAADFCVAWSALDAARIGFQAVVVEDATRGIGIVDAAGVSSLEASRRDLIAAGVTFTESGDLT